MKINNKEKLNRNELMKKFSSNELKEYLNDAIDTEMQKPMSEINTELIDKCVDQLLEIEGREVKIPEEKIRSITKSIVAKHYKSRRKILNILMVIAACIAVIFCIQFVSVTAFHENLFKDVYNEATHIIYHFTHHDDINKISFMSKISYQNKNKNLNL